MELFFLGTSAALVSKNRHNTSLLVKKEADLLLIDCNGACLQMLMKQGIDYENLSHIFFTHEHIDHMCAITNLVHQIWMKTCYAKSAKQEKRTKPLNIYGNSAVIKLVEKLLNLVDLPQHPDIFPIHFHDLGLEPTKAKIGNFDVEIFPVEHGHCNCSGVKIHNPKGKALVYSADTEICDAVTSRTDKQDVLVHECSELEGTHLSGHTTLSEIEANIERLNANELYIVHVPDVTEDAHARVKALAQTSGKKITIPDDGDSVLLR